MHFKSGDRCDPNNYRPISILPTISEILERGVHMQVYKYLIDNNILTPKQFGFRPMMSTSFALAHFSYTVFDNIIWISGGSRPSDKVGGGGGRGAVLNQK